MKLIDQLEAGVGGTMGRQTAPEPTVAGFNETDLDHIAGQVG